MGRIGKDSSVWFSRLGGLLIVVFILSALLPAQGTASTAYPVRLCSPESFRGDGTGGKFGTGNPRTDGFRTYMTRQGTMHYGDAGFMTVWHPALQCASLNTNNQGQFNYGMRMLTWQDVGFQRGQEGGIEIVPPAGTVIGQVSFKARALISPASGVQGGLGGGGSKLVWEFAGVAAGAGTHGEAVPSHTAFSTYGVAGAVQTASAFRFAQRCEPNGSATICFGPGESLLVQDLLVTVIDRNRPNLSILDTPISSGEWVSGKQRVSYLVQDGESGVRESQVFLDGKLISSKNYPCETVSGIGAGDSNLLMAARMKPCPTEITGDTITIDTSEFGDGEHELKVCARDFAASTVYWGQDPPACVTRTLRMDNSSPVAPEGLEAVPTTIPRVVEPNDATWNDPGKGDPGAPVMAATYEIVDSEGTTVVPSRTVKVEGPTAVRADSSAARNIEALSSIETPESAGRYTLNVRLIDRVGHVSRVSSIPLRYSCQDSGGRVMPETNVALGLLRRGYHETTATSKLVLQQGVNATLSGRVRGPSGMPVSGASICINSKPVTDTQLNLLTKVETNGQGQYRIPLKPGPSRNLVAVVRKGHRESWSEQALTRVKVRPTLRLKSRKIKAGQALGFRGKIPGPRNGQVAVVLQAKVGKGWQPFRTYRTRAGGKFRMQYRPRAANLTRPTKFIVRAFVPQQSGYPYQQGKSVRRVIVIRP